MPVFALIIMGVPLSVLALGILYLLITSIGQDRRLQKLRGKREGVPQEQQLAEFQAELTGSGRKVGSSRLVGVRVHRYPGLTTEQVVAAASALGPWQLAEAGEYRWFFRNGEPDLSAAVRRRLRRSVQLAVVPYTLAGLGVLWAAYPYVNWLAVAGICVAYGAGLLLLVRGDLGARRALVVLLVTLAVGIFPAWAAMVSSESYALERSGSRVELTVTAMSAPFSTRSGDNTTITVRQSDGSTLPGATTFNVKAGSYVVGDPFSVLVDPRGRWAPQADDSVPNPVGVIVTPTVGLLMAFMPIVVTSVGRRRRGPAGEPSPAVVRSAS